MRHLFDANATRTARNVAALGLLALLAGWLGLLLGGGASAAGGGSPAAGGRQVFLPLVASGETASPPTIADAGLNFAVALSPARQVAAGGLLRATITATNSGPTALTFRDLKLRHSADLVYERAEGDRLLVIGQSGDYTAATFRTIGPGETVAGTILFRVRAGLPAGTTITVEPEYVCGGGPCRGNLAQVQVGSALLDPAGPASADETQELLVAPASGGPETVFRFSSRKFTRLDTVELWLGSADSGVRQLPQAYRVGADGWVRFELKGSTFGVGSWNLLAHGSLSGYTSIASFTVTAGPAQVGAGGATPAGAALLGLAAPAADMAPAGGRPATPAQASGAGGIAGRVTDAGSGAGVADVLVVVLRDGQPVSSARTRASGDYLIAAGLATGSYEVRALAASAGGALSYQDAGYPQPVSVTSPDLTSGISFALARGGTIAGRVTASDTRRGLGGVGVEVLGPGGALVGSGASGADGSYAVEGLPEGSYSVRFVTETGDDGDVVAYAGATVAGVAVSAGATVFADQSLSLRPTVAKIRGRVSGAGGGLPEVFVAVFDSEAELVDLTLSEADGRYATGPLANGEYRVAFITFFADNALTRRHISAYFGGDTFAGAAVVAISAAGAVEDVSAALSLGGMIDGAVRGADGAALADVLVAAFDAGGVARAVGRSGADGAYRLPGLAAGSYRVGFFAEHAAAGAVRRYQDSFYSGKAGFAEADAVSVAAGQTVADIDGALSLGGAITGRVTADEGGAGLPGVVVIAFGGAGGIEAVAVTDTTGAYELPGLAPGPHTVLFDTILAPVEASRAYLDEYFDDRRAPPYAAVTVTAGTTATANAGLARGGQIAGRVTAADTGLGLGGVAVLVSAGDTLVSFTMSDASGAYTTAGLPAGSYTLRFDPASSADQETEQYAAQTRAGAVTVTVGAVTAGADVALVRP